MICNLPFSVHYPLSTFHHPLSTIPSMLSLNLTTIALAIFVVCAGFVLLRGAIRILLGCVVLGASAWVGFRDVPHDCRVHLRG